ncbi:hypothetical protein DXV65_25015 [Pseudomonas fluorescens]|nr:hypothetical protein DXV65_25015 [Pseudomonas fluorescens]
MASGTWVCCQEPCVWEPGLPAMQAPRFSSCTEVMLSQASQLPHKPAPTSASYHTGELPYWRAAKGVIRRCRAPGSYPAYGWRSPTRCHTRPTLSTTCH